MKEKYKLFIHNVNTIRELHTELRIKIDKCFVYVQKVLYFRKKSDFEKISSLKRKTSP